MSIFDELAVPFPPEVVSWRVGSTTQAKDKGLALAYIDARDVMNRLDEVVGPANWQCDYPHANGKTVCRIGLKIDGEWVWKSDGAGDTDHEAEKGALSDAFKRAAVRWGIGRYLYDVGDTWAEIEQKGRSYAIKKSEYQRLQKMLPDGRLVVTESHRLIGTVLKSAIGMAATLEALQAWGADETTKKTLEELPDEVRGDVRDAYMDRMKSLGWQPKRAAA